MKCIKISNVSNGKLWKTRKPVLLDLAMQNCHLLFILDILAKLPPIQMCFCYLLFDFYFGQSQLASSNTKLSFSGLTFPLGFSSQFKTAKTSQLNYLSFFKYNLFFFILLQRSGTNCRP